MTATPIDLKELIESAYEMAPLSPTSVRLAELVSDPNFYMDEVVELISFDQALTLKLLRSANSAAFGSQIRVSSVDEALAKLGIAQVLALTVASKVKSMLKARVSCYGLDEGALWQHSVAAAVSVEAMQTCCKLTTPPEAYTAALLHDIGKLVMGRFLKPEIMHSIQRAMEEDHLTRMQAETLLLTVHHAELGGLIAQHWKLPSRIVQGITYHHNPDEGQDVICDLTYAANEVAKCIEADLQGHKIELVLLPSVAERLALTPEKLVELCPAATTRFTQISQRYNAA